MCGNVAIAFGFLDFPIWHIYWSLEQPGVVSASFCLKLHHLPAAVTVGYEVGQLADWLKCSVIIGIINNSYEQLHMNHTGGQCKLYPWTVNKNLGIKKRIELTNYDNTYNQQKSTWQLTSTFYILKKKPKLR